VLQKLIDFFIIKNKKTGKPSYTTTMVVVGFAIINLKLLLSGIEIMDKVKMSEFSGVDYAAALSAIGAIHVGNKKLNGPKEENTKDVG
jgi:hypothetical protein